MAVAKAEIMDAIANMTVLELSQLIKDMEEKFGVPPPPPRWPLLHPPVVGRQPLPKSKPSSP